MFNVMSFAKHKPYRAIALNQWDIEDGHDFSASAAQIFNVLQTLHAVNLLHRQPFEDIDDVLNTILFLIKGINLNVKEYQTNEHHHIRIEYRDQLLSVEVFLEV